MGFENSLKLNDEQKELIRQKSQKSLSSPLYKEGILIVKVMETRSQEMNKQMALDVLQEIVNDVDHHYETQRNKADICFKERRLEGKK